MHTYLIFILILWLVHDRTTQSRIFHALCVFSTLFLPSSISFYLSVSVSSRTNTYVLQRVMYHSSILTVYRICIICYILPSNKNHSLFKYNQSFFGNNTKNYAMQSQENKRTIIIFRVPFPRIYGFFVLLFLHWVHSMACWCWYSPSPPRTHTRTCT